MLVVMDGRATPEQLANVLAKIGGLGLTAHPMPGPTRTAIGITGNASAIDRNVLANLPGVRELVRITQPYKLASREMQPDNSIINVGKAAFGGGDFTIVAGPCSVESEEVMLRIAEFLISRGVKLMRAGAFKPRTSPYSFQGAEQAGLDVLARVRERTGIGIVTEVMDASQIEAIEAATDLLQVGTRNMQNFSLLKELAKSAKPVLLKRGMAATLEEWLMAAEYLLAGGNRNVILCERGVRTFADHARNTLDLSVIPVAKQLSHLPALVDPSHGVGRRAFVAPMALAGLAAGADGLMVEIHPDPDRALSDGAQTIDFETFDKLLESLKKVAEALGRRID